MVAKLQIPRDPGAPKRTRFFIDVVANLLDALILSGAVQQTGQGTWQVTPTPVSLAGLSVYGRAANTTGAAAAITAAVDDQVLRRKGAAVGFGQINLGSAAAVTNRLALDNVQASSTISLLLGRGSASGAGSFQEITLDPSLVMTGTILKAVSSGAGGYHDEPLTDGNSNFIFAAGDIVVAVGVPN